MVRGELAMIEEKGPERDRREYIQPAWGDLAQGGELAGLAGGAPLDEPGGLVLLSGTLRVVFGLPSLNWRGLPGS
jgi:hypothetical protein